MQRACSLFFFFSTCIALAGCATDAEDADAESAISGTPGAARDRVIAEAEAARQAEIDRKFYSVANREHILGRYARAQPFDFQTTSHALGCFRSPEQLRVFSWGYWPELSVKNFASTVLVVERHAAGSIELSFVAHELYAKSPSRENALCEGSTVNTRARVLLRCSGVDAEHGPDPGRCSAPAEESLAARPR
jgi:hypothetical protein